MTKQDAPTTTDATSQSRAEFEAHWRKVRGSERAATELRSYPADPKVYINDSANHHLATWQAARASSAAAQQTDPIRSLIQAHEDLIEHGENYAYFELAYTRRTGWTAWLTDRSASGEPGTAEYAKSLKVIARGQGDSAEEACQDALDVMFAPPAKPADTGEASNG